MAARSEERPRSNVHGIEKARALWRKAGLAFPTIPEDLARQLKERGSWLFSTRALTVSPYDLQYYLEQAERKRVKGYAVVAHSGHGVNSYAIQYYLLYKWLRLFLHLGWGGVYMDKKAEAAKIRACFSTADKIVAMAVGASQFRTAGFLTVVCSDFYESYWLRPGEAPREAAADERKPLGVLTEALAWLKSNQELTE